MFTVCDKTPLPAAPCQTYRGAAFDGCQYYLTVSGACQIVVLDCGLQPVKTLTTRRPYSALCYDCKRGCFWAAAQDCGGALFQLSAAMQETDRLDVCLKGRPETLTSVSFCCGSGRLLVSLPGKLLQIQPSDGSFRLLYEAPKAERILSALCLSPYLLLYVLRDGKPYFLVRTDRGKPLMEEPGPISDCIYAMLYCAQNQDGPSQLLLLTNKRGCYPRLLHISLPSHLCRGLCLCRPSDGNCPPPGRSLRPQALADIWESIAQQQAALAHILTAQREQLQNTGAASPHELLRINQSVQKTLEYVLQLEQGLFARLDAFRELYGQPASPPRPPLEADISGRKRLF